MPRIDCVDLNTAPPEIRAAYEARLIADGHVTNMKRTLLRNLPSYHALMEWFPLRDEALKFITEREVNLFCHAISTQNECLLCSTFFRRILIEAGENPDAPALNDREKALVDFGRAAASKPPVVDNALFGRLRGFFSEEQIVVLTAFAGLMVATNLINTVLDVELDDDIKSYARR